MKKHREQAEQIEVLEDKVRAVRNKIEEIEIPEEFPDLEKLKGQVKEAAQKKADLEKELEDLEVKKKEAAENLEKYKKDYPIR